MINCISKTIKKIYKNDLRTLMSLSAVSHMPRQRQDRNHDELCSEANSRIVSPNPYSKLSIWTIIMVENKLKTSCHCQKQFFLTKFGYDEIFFQNSINNNISGRILYTCTYYNIRLGKMCASDVGATSMWHLTYHMAPNLKKHLKNIFLMIWHLERQIMFL